MDRKSCYAIGKTTLRNSVFSNESKKKILSNAADFHHCTLTNVKLYLNSEVYPYDNININFELKQYATLYEMFVNFQSSYYYRDTAQPCVSPANFKSKIPFVVIDCSHQIETIKTGAIDIRLEFETKNNIPEATSGFCLILNDRLVKYNPLTNAVKIM